MTYDIHAAIVTVFLCWAVGVLILQTLQPARNGVKTKSGEGGWSLVRAYGSVMMILIWSRVHILDHTRLMSVRMLLQAQHSD